MITIQLCFHLAPLSPLLLWFRPNCFLVGNTCAPAYLTCLSSLHASCWVVWCVPSSFIGASKQLELAGVRLT